MKKTAIRNGIYPLISSQMCMHEYYHNSLKRICHKRGVNWTLQEILTENQYGYDQLYTEYLSFLSSERSEWFMWMYELNDQYGVSLDGKIVIYRRSEVKHRKFTKTTLGWEYTESARCMGNRDGYSDEEILHDLNTLSMLAFAQKYNGYMT